MECVALLSKGAGLAVDEGVCHSASRCGDVEHGIWPKAATKAVNYVRGTCDLLMVCDGLGRKKPESQAVIGRGTAFIPSVALLRHTEGVWASNGIH